MYFKCFFLLMGTIMMVLSTKVIAEKAEGASEKLNSAFRSCEKGLNMKMPKSRGSLKVLQSHFNSYQRNRDAALQIDDTLKSSKSEYYEGTSFVKKTFAEVYDICEKTFAQKVSEATAKVSEKVQGIEDKQKQSQADLEKNKYAKQQLALAVNKYCVNSSLRPQQEANSSSYNAYQAAKQKSIEIYPEIIREYFTATFKNPTSGMVSRFNKSVKEWFEYCDKVFIGQAKKLEPVTHPEGSDKNAHQGKTPSEKEVPSKLNESIEMKSTAKPSQLEEKTTKEDAPKKAQEANSEQPPTTTMTTTPSTASKELEMPPTEETTKENTTEASSDNEVGISEDKGTEVGTPSEHKGTDEDKTEYEGILAQMKADRLKVLKEEGRLPDFVNDEEYNYQKASIWQFEKDNGNKCSIYNFRGDQLLKAQKDFKGECPPF